MTAIELRHLCAFVAITDDLHLGERLELSPSALNRIVVDLEGITGRGCCTGRSARSA